MQKNAPIEHSAILSTFIKLPFVFKTFVLSTFEWPISTGFTTLQRVINDNPDHILHGGEGWSVPLLFTCNKSVFSYQGSYLMIRTDEIIKYFGHHYCYSVVIVKVLFNSI